MLSVLSFNTLCDVYEAKKIYTDARIPAAIGLLRARQPALIQLQEVTPRFAEALLAEPWVRDSYQPSSRPGQGLWEPHGLLTLSRLPVARVLHVVLTEGKRPAVIVEIRLGEAGAIFANVHLSSNHLGGPRARAAECRRLIEALAQPAGTDRRSVLVAGDMNFADESESRIFADEGFVDLWPALKGDAPGCTFDPGINPLARALRPGKKPKRLDRMLWKRAEPCLLSPLTLDLLADAQTADGRFISDHFALEARFELKTRLRAE